MKHLMLFVDGFEDVEAIATLDVLLRGNEEVTKVSLMGRNEVISKSGNKIYIDDLIENINYKKFDSLIISSYFSFSIKNTGSKICCASMLNSFLQISTPEISLVET